MDIEEDEEERGTYSCLLIQLDHQTKNDTHVLTDSNPWRTIYNTNGRKDKRLPLGHWEIEMVVGPFTDASDAIKFSKHWNGAYRGVISKRNQAERLTNIWREKYPELRCYDKRLVPVDYNQHLNDHNLQPLTVDQRQLDSLYGSLQVVHESLPTINE